MRALSVGFTNVEDKSKCTLDPAFCPKIVQSDDPIFTKKYGKLLIIYGIWSFLFLLYFISLQILIQNFTTPATMHFQRATVLSRWPSWRPASTTCMKEISN